ncbi:unnamed protein product [Rangifer tarandus platyrhynchus]|uniref:Uncharacterized protein n=2 Tax=Rangifer tarandus platyrhynchus TaxID=3082113 RepID=A0ABN8Z6A5_RANTA|nr:unnamed protein product [Rangifer tarandus platyrhynchus]CAI9703805.1 unnamed protein product [Rangifer tarandus platyrhynchus]
MGRGRQWAAQGEGTAGNAHAAACTRNGEHWASGECGLSSDGAQSDLQFTKIPVANNKRQCPLAIIPNATL